MEILAHAILVEGCPFAPLNAMYEGGIMVKTVVDVETGEIQPTLGLDGSDHYWAIVGNVPSLYRNIIEDIVRKNHDTPNPIRCAYVHEGILAIPPHWIKSLMTGICADFLPDYAGEGDA